MTEIFIGIDAGSVSAKTAVINHAGELIDGDYALHRGNPLAACKSLVEKYLQKPACICATGSARKIAGKALSAQLIKNEITALWRGVSEKFPHAGTIIEIGGQDSKLITLNKGEIDSFRLNSVCAAGTGSFIQQQAARLGMSVDELSAHALSAQSRAHFSGRCTVFVETEMINLQQRGFTVESIAAGLSDAVCENYLKDLSPGMKMREPYVFCGGVAALDSVAASFERLLGGEILRPDFFRTAGAYGAALLARDLCASDESIAATPVLWKDTEFNDMPGSECSDCLNCGKCRE